MRNVVSISFFFILLFCSCDKVNVDNKGLGIAAERSNWRMKQKNYPNVTDIIRAKKEYRKFLQSNKNLNKDAGIVGWEELGPDNIGGRVRALVPLSDGNTLIAGTAGGGLLRATRNGSQWNWEVIDDFAPKLAISTLAINRSGANDVIYAGTGETFACRSSFCGDGLPGDGIYKTINNGISWSHITIPGSNLFWIPEIAVDQNDPDIVFVLENDNTQQGQQTSSGRIHKSTDGGITWDSPISTYLNGASTQNISQVCDIKIDPFDSQNVLVSIVSASYSSFRLLKSTDGGTSFERVSTGLPIGGGRAEIAFAPSVQDKVYISLNDNNGGEIYLSLDGGDSWTSQGADSSFLCNYLFPTSCQGDYDNTIWVDPLNSNRLILGGIDLFRSNNSGQNLTRISDWVDFHNGDDLDQDGQVANSPHADHHIIIEDPNYSASNRRVFFGNDGGVAISNNITSVSENSGWQLLNDNGFAASQFYQADIATRSNGDVIALAGAQDNSYLQKNDVGNGLDWIQQTTGDGAFSAIDPSNTNQIITSTQQGSLARTLTGGSFSTFARFNFSCNGSTNSCCSGGLPANGCVDGGNRFLVADSPNFIAPLCLDPNNSNVLIFGGNRLWRNNNCWSTTSNNFVPIIGSQGAPDVSAIKLSNQTSDYWVGYDDGTLIYSNDGNNFSTPITIPGSSNSMVTDIGVSPFDENVVVVALAGYNTNNLWLSTNAKSSSRTWMNINPNLSVQINAIEWSPYDPNWIYIGTDFGLLSSEDLGSNWTITPLNSGHDGPVNTEVADLDWDGSGRLYAATHGRGLWRTTFQLFNKIYVDKDWNPPFPLPSNGSIAFPYTSFTDALEHAGNGSEIVFLSDGVHEEIPSLVSKHIIDKRITITLQNGGNSVILKEDSKCRESKHFLPSSRII